MKLALPDALRTGIEAQARAAYPRECCGLLEGVRDGDVAQVLAFHPARNIAAANDRFEIDPGDHFAALKAARAHGRAIIGCYHSHPGGAAVPSAIDRAAAVEDGFLWLIAALKAAEGPVALSAYDYSGTDFFPLAMRAVGADFVTSSEKQRK
jgi:proteasome lid subunit RPN8/RPN11